MLKSVTPYLLFDGECQEALDFYENYFDAKVVEKLMFSDFEMEDTSATKIANARFT